MRIGLTIPIPTPRLGLDDTALRGKLRELASQRRRFDYRRLALMLERQGIKLNAKKLYQLKGGAADHKGGGRKRASVRAP